MSGWREWTGVEWCGVGDSELFEVKEWGTLLFVTEYSNFGKMGISSVCLSFYNSCLDTVVN